MTESGGFYPYNPALGQEMQTDVDNYEVDRSFLAHIELTALQAVAADTDGVHAAFASAASEQTIATAITSPVYPRNITAITAGTVTDVEAVSVIITGTDMADEVITETLPVFTLDTQSTVVGDKAFKTVTSILVPAFAGVIATIAIGWGDKLGIPFTKAVHKSVGTWLDNSLEATPATFAASATVLSSNTMDLATALNGTVVDSYLVV